MQNRDGPNLFKNLIVDGRVTIVYSDYFVTLASAPDGSEHSITVSNTVWEKKNEDIPLPNARDVISLGNIRLLHGGKYRSYEPSPKS